MLGRSEQWNPDVTSGMTVDPCKSSTVKVHQNFSVMRWNMLGNIVKKNPEMRRINYFRCLNESCDQRWRWRVGYKHTLIADKTQILNNLGYISKTVNRNSQNKKHFTYITQFTRHLCLTREPRVNYSNHGKKQWYTVKITKHSTKLVLICHSLNYLSP